MSGTTAQPDKVSVITPLVVSVVAEAIFLAAIVIAWWTKDASLGILLGAAATNATTVVNYWLGSSSGSKAKDATIAQQASVTPLPGTTTTTTTPPLSNTLTASAAANTMGTTK
jgi:hypothetical protein